MIYNRHDGFTFEWNMSKTVNIYTPNGANVDVFSLDYSRNDHTVEEVITAADEWEVCLV